MTSYTSYASINTLSEFSLVAGSYFILDFSVYEEDGVSPIDLTGGTIKWVLSPYGESSFNVLQKNATITGTGTFRVVLSSSDTASLSGKYIQQPVITDFTGKIFRPAQGTVLVIPQTPTT